MGTLFTTAVPDGSSAAVTVVYAVTGAGFGAAVFSCALLGVLAGLSTRDQREEARDRLRHIKRAASEHRIVPIDARSLTNNFGLVVHAYVRNDGPGGQFAALLVDLEGIDGELLDPYQHVQWGNRHGVMVEEIPVGDQRTIGIFYMAKDLNSGQLLIQPIDAFGERNREYRTPVGGGEVRAVIRVVLRNQPQVGYARTFKVAVTWDGNPDHDERVSLLPGEPDAERRYASFDSLLDY
jgi:hypothetical protein